MDYSGRSSVSSVGQFDAKNWFEEGDGLLASSLKLREVWIDHHTTFLNTVQERKSGNWDRATDWNLLTGLPRASVLLLGYSVEVYLKAGLVKACCGCSEEMFEGYVKGERGHNLVLLGDEIAFGFKNGDRRNLEFLRGMTMAGARYPVFVEKGADYVDEVNRRTGEIWSAENFEALIELADRVREHSRSIDADRNNPALFKSFKVDDDGYLTFRVGGNLPPRITYRLSTNQVYKGEQSLDDIKALFLSQLRGMGLYWEKAWIYEDGKKNGKQKTWRRAQPSV